MKFLSAGTSLSICGCFEKLSFKANVGSLVQVRTATKRASGSKTNMKDSAGRRLGAKKGENQPVKRGEIIFRQRGTKFYPGENVGIGKDHTIFALEPGYVRYYLDPFHPKRKFIGVTFDQDTRLPTPHFSPRSRRLGYVPLIDEKASNREEVSLSRKAYQAKQELDEQLKIRQQKRTQLVTDYEKQLKELVPELEGSELEWASQRLLFLRGCKLNGIESDEAYNVGISIFLQNLKLSLKKNEISQEQFETEKKSYQKLAETLKSKVSFDNANNLIPYISEEERLTKVGELKAELEKLHENITNNKSRTQIRDLIFGSTILTDSETVYFKRRYYKSVLPKRLAIASTSDKKARITRQWDYEKRKVETIARPTNAFAPSVSR